jgi:hypothetical protein
MYAAVRITTEAERTARGAEHPNGEDKDFANEAAQAGEAEAGKENADGHRRRPASCRTGRRILRVAMMDPVVNHADHKEHTGRADAVANHLEHRPRTPMFQ